MKLDERCNRLDNQLISKQFELIESRVQQLMDRNRSLETINQDLTNQIATLEEELREQRETEMRFAAERDLIRTKVDGLLARLADAATE